MISPNRDQRGKIARKSRDRRSRQTNARDRSVNRELRALGWRVVRVWEHELKRRNEGRLLAKLRRAGITPRP